MIRYIGDAKVNSAYGTFDQGGNVNELSEAMSGAYHPRGGASGSSAYNLSARDRSSLLNSATWSHTTMGFRIVQVPEPASISLLALGGLAMLRRRR